MDDVGRYLHIVDAHAGRAHRPDGNVAAALRAVLAAHRTDVLAELLNGVDLECAGVPVDQDCRPAGEPCGAVYRGPVDSARFAGWRVGDPDPDGTRPTMCPRCAAPAPGGPKDCGQLLLEPLPGL